MSAFLQSLGDKIRSGTQPATDFVHDNQPFFNNLGSTLKSVALPAMAAGIGSGALAGYLSSQDKRPDELPAERRKRIIRNAIYGLAAGGVAGTAIPLGMQALSAPMTGGKGPPLLDRGVDTAFDFGTQHALPLAVGGIGGASIYAAHGADRENALKSLHRQLGGEPKIADEFGKIISAPKLGAITESEQGATAMIHRYMREIGIKLKDQDPSLTADELKRFNAGTQSTNLSHLFRAREKVHEAGGKWVGLDELSKSFKSQTPYGQNTKLKYYSDAADASNGMRPALARHLEEEGGLVGKQIGRWLRKSHPNNLIPSSVPEWLAENYSRYVRPTAKSTWLPTPAKIGLLGGGVLLANQLQKRVFGE